MDHPRLAKHMSTFKMIKCCCEIVHGETRFRSLKLYLEGRQAFYPFRERHRSEPSSDIIVYRRCEHEGPFKLNVMYVPATARWTLMAYKRLPSLATVGIKNATKTYDRVTVILWTIKRYMRWISVSAVQRRDGRD